MTNTNLLRSALLLTTRVPDHTASVLKSAGGKHDLSRKIPALAPFKVEEFREIFAGSAASLFAMIRAGRCERGWLNDLNPGIAGFWTVVQQHPEALVRELYRLEDKYGLGSQEMFDIARQMVESDNQIEAATGFYMRNRLSRSGTNGMSGFNPSYPRDGRGIKRHQINYIRQFSAWLRNVRITNLDYREVLDEPGDNVFVMADPPYSNVGKTMYPFGNADLAELARRVRTSPHSCLVTVDDTPTNRVLYSDMTPIMRNYVSTMGDHHAASELICPNYPTPLYAIHARDIGVMLEHHPVAANANDVAGLPSDNPLPAHAEVVNDSKEARRRQVKHLFVREGSEQKNFEWYTPKWLLNHFYAANDGQPFDLDPCSPARGIDAPVWAHKHFTIADNGLARDWHGCVWLNPPFHGLGAWVEKAADAVWCSDMPNPPTQASAKREKPLCEVVVGLIPARTHRHYWRNFVSEHARVFFMTGTLSFLKGIDGKGVAVNTRLPEGLAFVVWGNHTRFTNALRALPGSVLDIYERSAPVTPDHPVRYWNSIRKAA